MSSTDPRPLALFACSLAFFIPWPNFGLAPSAAGYKKQELHHAHGQLEQDVASCIKNKYSRQVRSPGDPPKKFSRPSARLSFFCALFSAPLARPFFQIRKNFPHVSGQRPGTLPSPRPCKGRNQSSPPQDLGKGGFSRKQDIDNANVAAEGWGSRFRIRCNVR